MAQGGGRQWRAALQFRGASGDLLGEVEDRVDPDSDRAPEVLGQVAHDVVAHGPVRYHDGDSGEGVDLLDTADGTHELGIRGVRHGGLLGIDATGRSYGDRWTFRGRAAAGPQAGDHGKDPEMDKSRGESA
jgi:hypothetical protein